MPDFDVVVIGAGIQGAGVAQAAAARGHSVLLVEKAEPAAGTSSRSSKLIHGGLRYLETFQIGLVRESLAERATLARIAPGLVRWVPFFIPVYGTTRRRPWKIRLGLSLYALLGGLDANARFRKVPRGDWGGLDGLSTDGLDAVFRYQDAATDDAELTRAVVRSAASLGARIETHTSFLSARRERDGYRVAYRDAGGERSCLAGVLVNAAGPWVGQVQTSITGPDGPLQRSVRFELVQGAHIVLAGLTERGIYYTEAPRDGRPVFIMPWKGNTLVGTTETPFSGNPDDVAPLPGEIDYLLDVFRTRFPGRPARLLKSFAGLRVLPTGPGAHGARPREVVLVADDPAAPRLVAIHGGKLTGYRQTARKVMDRLAPSLPPATRPGDTSRIRIS